MSTVNNDQIHIDGARAVQMLRAVVAEHGAGTVYALHDRDSDPGVDHTYAMCRYVHHGCPDCLIGRALALAGVTVDELVEMDTANRTGIASVPLPPRLLLTEQARAVFRAAQLVQDSGGTWGEALAAAEAVIA